ncbi:MAG TPA: heavy metal-associated domain-containing protein [Syntrophales bacterium]|nr:heavy metal-associated domain-containing protein [Syntrophales bacterium]
MKKIKIKGMSCRHCAAAVKKALSEIDGVRNVNIDLLSNEASFEEEKPVDPALIEKAVHKAGYEVV